jgi:hypothetical protein
MYVLKFINYGIDPHDAAILSEIMENLKEINGSEGKLISYDQRVKLFEKYNRNTLKDFGNPLDPIEDFWAWESGAFYQVNEKGTVTLIWAIHSNEPPCPFLMKIPVNLLELSYLKYLWLLCLVKKESIPSTLRSNGVFEVNINSITKDSSLFKLYIRNEEFNIDEFFELKIVRKELAEEIEKDNLWLFREAFRKEQMNS